MKLKLSLTVSVVLNLLLLIYFLLPKSFYLGGIGDIYPNSSREVGGFVKGINFNEKDNSSNYKEIYKIFGYFDVNNEEYLYFYTNYLGNKSGFAMTALKKLEINYEDKNKIILYDDVYEFEIYKKENKVLGKDKNGSKFELVQFGKL